MGFSGIISSVLKNPIAAAQDPCQQWRLAFLSAFMLSAYVFLFPTFDKEIVENNPSVNSAWAYGLSGLLVRPPKQILLLLLSAVLWASISLILLTYFLYRLDLAPSLEMVVLQVNANDESLLDYGGLFLQFKRTLTASF